jgi:hypothetical protein
MEREYDTNGAAPAPTGVTAAPAFDVRQALSLAEGLMGEGPLPEWMKVALGAAAVAGTLGAVVSMLGSGRKPRLTTAPPPQPQVTDRVQRLMTGKDGREYPIGFIQPNIPPQTGAIDVVSRPQLPFLGERLVIPLRVARRFSVIDIRVGNRSQLANSTAIPATAFTPTAKVMRIALDVAEVAQDIALVVENETNKNQTFQAVLIGTGAKVCDACGGYGRPQDRC